MGKKYLLEIEENKDGSFAWSNFAPYTAPDLEQVRTEAYDEGFNAGRTLNTGKYEKGLNDAWEAARKICLNDSDGGLTVTEIAKIFDVSYYRDAMKKYSAAEALKEIRAYEQAQKEKEEIKVGNEVITASGKAVVTGVGPVYFEYVNADGSGYDEVKNAKKTGRHFPEIAEVLRKMKGEADD